MSIKELIAVVKSPKHPMEKGDARKWRAVQKRLGVRLPKDLYSFGKNYGTGCLCGGFIAVYNPFSASYMKFIETECESLRHANKRGKDWYVVVYPEAGGLFPWGMDQNGNSMYWRMNGSPNDWPIMLREHGFPKLEEWDLPMTTFLAKALTNKIKTVIWDPFAPDQLNFKQVNY